MIDLNKIDPKIIEQLKTYDTEYINRVYGDFIGIKKLIQCTRCYETFNDLDSIEKHFNEKHKESSDKECNPWNKQIIKIEYETTMTSLDNADSVDECECFDIDLLPKITYDKKNIEDTQGNATITRNKDKLFRYSLKVKPDNLMRCLDKCIEERKVRYPDIVINKSKEGYYSIFYYKDKEVNKEVEENE